MSEAAPTGRTAPLDDLLDLIGQGKTVALIDAVGGCDMDFPTRVTETCRLAQIVGVDAARALVDHFGTGRIYIPKPRRTVDVRRLRAEAETTSRPKLARSHGITERHAYRLLAGAPPDPRQPSLFDDE